MTRWKMRRLGSGVRYGSHAKMPSLLRQGNMRKRVRQGFWFDTNVIELEMRQRREGGREEGVGSPPPPSARKLPLQDVNLGIMLASRLISSVEAFNATIGTSKCGEAVVFSCNKSGK